MAFMYIDNTILLVLVILVVMYVGRRKRQLEAKKEGYRSCCWRGCEGNCKDIRPLRTMDFVEMNPFIAPNSAFMCIEDRQLRKLDNPLGALGSEADHIPLST